MACPSGTITYSVLRGDTIYKIAAKFNVAAQVILTANPGVNPNTLYIGQQVCIPQSKAVAQVADRPILVNGANINLGLYPVLNYRPPNAQYPYIYVPIAEFSRVGANVVWNEAQQLLTVQSDYYKIQSDYQKLELDLSNARAEYFEELVYCERQIDELTAENERLKTQVSNIVTIRTDEYDLN